MSNYIFRLGKTTGFEKNYGCVKGVGSSNYDRYRMENELLSGEVLFDIDGKKFTLEQADNIAWEKAEELFGKSDIDFQALADQFSAKPTN